MDHIILVFVLQDYLYSYSEYLGALPPENQVIYEIRGEESLKLLRH
jgi:hypothetical protein